MVARRKKPAVAIGLEKEREELLAKIKVLEASVSRRSAELRHEKRLRKEAERDVVTANLRAATTAINPKPIVPKKFVRGGKVTAVICLNDWHCEETIDPDVINGMNEFNLTIANKRITKAWHNAVKLIDFASNLARVQRLLVWFGGDLVNGTIHEELEETNGLGPTEAKSFIQDQMARGLDFVYKETGLPIDVVTSVGNHGRTTRRKRHSTAYKHNWEWDAYNVMADYKYNNHPKINWKIEKSYFNIIEVQKHILRFHHGEDINHRGGIGGPMVNLRKKMLEWSKTFRNIDLDIIGHFHQFSDSNDAVICPALVGYNAYAQFIGAPCQPPQQLFLTIDRERGKTMCLPIFCD